MTSDEIISMAEKVDPYGKLGKLYEMAELTPGTLERFAALVAAAEREACAITEAQHKAIALILQGKKAHYEGEPCTS